MYQKFPDVIREAWSTSLRVLSLERKIELWTSEYALWYQDSVGRSISWFMVQVFFFFKVRRKLCGGGNVAYLFKICYVLKLHLHSIWLSNADINLH